MECPPDITFAEIRDIALGVKGVLDFQHIHIWAISTTENALTAHLIVSENISADEEFNVKQTLRQEFQHKNIQHITFETERQGMKVSEQACNITLTKEKPVQSSDNK